MRISKSTFPVLLIPTTSHHTVQKASVRAQGWAWVCKHFILFFVAAAADGAVKASQQPSRNKAQAFANGWIYTRKMAWIFI